MFPGFITILTAVIFLAIRAHISNTKDIVPASVTFLLMVLGVGKLKLEASGN